MFQPAYDDGSRVHSNSWGSPRDLGAYTGMSQQVDEFMWNNPEYLILFAAGNSGVDEDKDGRIDEGSVSSPGTAKNALTVGASENYLLEGGIQRTLGELLGGEPWGTEPLASDRLSDDEAGLAAFSSRGPTRDGRLKPEIVAPGTNIVSVCSRVEDATKLWGNYDENYCYAGGTSMSTPITAGGAAVARQFLAEEMNISSPSAALVKGLLMHSAHNLFPGQYGDRGKSSGQELLVDGPNVHQGFGRLDMEAATNKSALYELVDNKQGLAVGERFQTTVTLEDSKPLRVTLVYTDAPADPSVSRTLVNNLDLKVIMNGQELLADSTVNNHEQIVLSSISGEVRVEVVAKNVPMGKNGKQPFALVIGR
jgi:serine protease AprX